MMRFLKVLGLVAAIMMVSGCGGHYVLDGYIDQSQIVSSDDPNAIKVYVGEYRFNDGPGGPQSLNKSTAKGEISPWIKKALVNEIGNIAFVGGKEKADIIIETQKVEFNVGPKNVILTNINGNSLLFSTYFRTYSVLPLTDHNFSDMLTVTTKLIADVLKDNIFISNGKITVSNLPKEVRVTARRKNNVLEIYDKEIKKAGD